MATGYIPRGKGRAPKQSIPEQAIDKAPLTAMCKQAGLQIDRLEDFLATACFKHPLFGWLNKKTNSRFCGYSRKASFKDCERYCWIVNRYTW
jgi:hypothetical protein